jgi:hypothetical protein
VVLPAVITLRPILPRVAWWREAKIAVPGSALGERARVGLVFTVTLTGDHGVAVVRRGVGVALPGDRGRGVGCRSWRRVGGGIGGS